MRILILGHTGMLGNAVYKYYNELGFDIETTDLRWSNELKDYIINTKCEWIINCIGSIPQKSKDFIELNINLPIFLFLSGKKIIHPGSDAEFSGKDGNYTIDSTPDPIDEYGFSKSVISEISKKFKNDNFFIIRSSIIGLDNDKKSLLSWVLYHDFIRGYKNVYWNGITTLEWAKISHSIINKSYIDKIIQPCSECISKYDLIKTIIDIFKRDIELVEDDSISYNRCLVTNIGSKKNIKDMLLELKSFYSI